MSIHTFTIPDGMNIEDVKALVIDGEKVIFKFLSTSVEIKDNINLKFVHVHSEISSLHTHVYLQLHLKVTHFGDYI